MQTAIDWLMGQYVKNDSVFLAGVYEQAKEIEKRQHETTFHRGINIGAFNPQLDIEGRKESARHYYETTFLNKMPKNEDGKPFVNTMPMIETNVGNDGLCDAKSIYGSELNKELTLDERMHLWFESARPNRDVCDYVDEMNDVDKGKYLDEVGISRTTKI